MRPLVLNTLFASLTSLPGVGPKLELLYARLLDREAPRVIDLLMHLPSGIIDRRARPKLRDVAPGQVVTVSVTVEEHRAPPPHRSRAPYRILTSDDTGTLTLTFFNARKDYLEKLLPQGATRYVSGTAEFYDGMLQMVHPDRVVDEKGFADLPLVEPVYPLTEGLALGNVRRAMDGAILKLPALPEWQDEAWLSRERSRHSATRCAICTGRLSRTTSRRTVWPGRGSLTTNCSPASWRWLWCARICAARPVVARPAKAACARKFSKPCPTR
jgi:ATP-dependent DNA helicase RecG